MDIISGKSHRELLEFLPQIKLSADEWQLVEIRLTKQAKELAIENIGSQIHAMFHSKEGKIYLCNDHEAIMIIRSGLNTDPGLLARQIISTLPKDSCEVRIHEPSPDKLAKLEIFINIDNPNPLVFTEERSIYKKNIILVADDDMYMRMLVKKGLGPDFEVIESVDGTDVVSNYKKHAPDMVFLDIHMPGKDGLENLRNILAIDPDAYIIMLSADSSTENVMEARKLGVKGFLTKPFTKERLMEHVSKCPAIC